MSPAASNPHTPGPQLRIENLTLHPVSVDVAHGDQVSFEPVGRPARVNDPQTRASTLNVSGEDIRWVTLRRSRKVAGLPRPRSGVLYLVPRLTALAARNRTDLVFWHDEHRDQG